VSNPRTAEAKAPGGSYLSFIGSIVAPRTSPRPRRPSPQRLLVRRGKGRIRIYQEDGRAPVVICSQLRGDDISAANMAEYLAAEVVEKGVLSLASPIGRLRNDKRSHRSLSEDPTPVFSLQLVNEYFF
jgi:hypothetical protein